MRTCGKGHSLCKGVQTCELLAFSYLPVVSMNGEWVHGGGEWRDLRRPYRHSKELGIYPKSEGELRKGVKEGAGS